MNEESPELAKGIFSLETGLEGDASIGSPPSTHRPERRSSLASLTSLDDILGRRPSLYGDNDSMEGADGRGGTSRSARLTATNTLEEPGLLGSFPTGNLPSMPGGGISTSARTHSVDFDAQAETVYYTELARRGLSGEEGSIADRQRFLVEQQREIQRRKIELEAKRKRLMTQLQIDPSQALASLAPSVNPSFLSLARSPLGASMSSQSQTAGLPGHHSEVFRCSMDHSLRSASVLLESTRSVVEPGIPIASQGPFAQMDRPRPLACDADKEWLTPLQCFIRKYCIEVFTASDEDVKKPSRGKRKHVQVGQVGVRCMFCHRGDRSTSEQYERGGSYYPSSISGLYHASMNLLQRHVLVCKALPDSILQQYDSLRSDEARCAMSKRYWVESAQNFGLVDSPSGIRYSAVPPPPLPTRNEEPLTQSQHDAYTQQEVYSSMGNDGYAHANGDAQATRYDLVTPEDRPIGTAFIYELIRQMTPCLFTEADRLGKRKGLPPGYAGLACKHCLGHFGSGRFFPSSLKTLSDTSKTLNVLHNHLQRCRGCPDDMKTELVRLRATHDEERAQMKFGSQKAFFGRIWNRLHSNEQTSTPSSSESRNVSSLGNSKVPKRARTCSKIESACS